MSSYREVLDTICKVIEYEQEDDYSGKWVALVRRGDKLSLVSDYFGSCSGCDALESALDDYSYQGGEWRSRDGFDYLQFAIDADYTFYDSLEDFLLADKWDSDDSWRSTTAKKLWNKHTRSI